MAANSARRIPQQQVTTRGTQASDEQIIARMRAKGSNRKLAFDTLIQRHQRWVFQRCLYYIGNHHDAEDTVQEILLRVYRGLTTFEGRASFRSWLNSIVHNQCKTFVTRRARLKVTENIAHSIQLFEELRYSHSSTWFDERAQVARTLALMPRPAREILYLRYFKDCPLNQIAQRLDISLSAAKMRLYRAIELLKLHHGGETCSRDVGTH